MAQLNHQPEEYKEFRAMQIRSMHVLWSLAVLRTLRLVATEAARCSAFIAICAGRWRGEMNRS